MTEEVVEEVVVQRRPGQEIGNTGVIFLVPETPRVGHRADADAWTRSKKQTYKRKIAAQRKAKGK